MSAPTINPRILDFLVSRGAATIAHSGRVLLEHLLGTHALLSKWGCTEAVSVGGLFHSIYGTNAFDNACVSSRERGVLQALIGTDAERLAYWFCASNRPRALYLAARGATLIDRFTGRVDTPPRDVLAGLIEIECANLIEQDTGAPFLRAMLDLHKDTPILREPVFDNVSEFVERDRA